MKAAIIEGGVTGGPSFEATSKYGTDGRMRSEIAVSSVKRLIHRDPQKRPSAQEAFPYPRKNAQIMRIKVQFSSRLLFFDENCNFVVRKKKIIFLGRNKNELDTAVRTWRS